MTIQKGKVNKMSDILNAMTQQAKNPNVPILGKEPEVNPLFQLYVFQMEGGEVPFEAALTLMRNDHTIENNLITPVYNPRGNPDMLSPIDWFKSSLDNQKSVQMFWITRAMGCLLAMAQTLEPNFKLKSREVRDRIKALRPEGRALTPEESQAYQDELASAKQRFLQENPNFDPGILTRRDEGGMLAQAKHNIETRHLRADGSEFPEQGGAYEPEGGFKPRDPRVLNPHIEVVSPTMLDGSQ